MQSLSVLVLFLLMAACLWAAAWQSPAALRWIAAQCLARCHSIAEKRKSFDAWLTHLEGGNG